MSDKINILFLGGAKRVSLAELFIAAGKKAGKEVHIFSYELDPYVPIASIGTVLIGLRWNDEEILNHLTETITKHDINMVLPFVDGATVIAARLKNKLKGVFIPVSGETTCEVMFDKVKANEWFTSKNITVPGNNGLPLIAKPRNGSASKGLIIIRSTEEWNSFRNNFDERDFLLQNYLTADEYTVDAYVSKSGECMAVVPRRRMEVTSGEATKSITVKDLEIIALSKRILQLTHFSGPITLQFLREKSTHKLYIMEINPRFGGGVVTAIRAGADMPMMLLNEYLNKPLKVIEDWEEHLIMTRAFREFFYHATNN
jgi:carbamoyl-phosphate synthase large subunit